jgi:hypothetical protein
MPTRITALEVPAESDAAFLDAVPPGSAVYRALRADVTLRFVQIAPAEDPPPAALPFPAHSGVYEIAHEDGEPEGAGGTVLITPFDVPADGDEEFVGHWERLRALFAQRQGYLGARLDRSSGPADFRFVAIVRWSSPLMYARTLQQPAVEEAMAAQPFPGRPALYIAPL